MRAFAYPLGGGSAAFGTDEGCFYFSQRFIIYDSGRAGRNANLPHPFTIMQDNSSFLPVKVAVVQAAPVLFDLEASLTKVEQLVREAASAGARLVLFPESFLPAYPRGLGFGAVVGSRTEAGRRQWQRYWEGALPMPGAASQFLGELARQAGIYLVIGVTERDAEGHTLYCSLLYYGPQGQLLGRHRKLKPTASERIIWGEGAGDDLQVHATEFGRLGGLICWENLMPLARMALYQQGVDIYLAPTADARESWQSTLRHIACEGRCFVLGCNQFVATDQYPHDMRPDSADSDTGLCRGGSAIIDPYGRYLAGPVYDTATVLYADLHPGTIIQAKMDFDAAGHYHRPDVFTFDWKKG